MKLKNIIGFLLLSMAFVTVACDDDVEYTITEVDAPRIGFYYPPKTALPTFRVAMLPSASLTTKTCSSPAVMRISLSLQAER